MNLEQRVEMLEQEVQVLKSQIQATLLEIQEFVLTNSFSSLRAEEPATSHHKPPMAAEQSPNPGAVPYVSGGNNTGIHHQISATPQNSPREGGSEPQIRVNKLDSVDEIAYRDPRHDPHREAAHNAPYADTDRPRPQQRQDRSHVQPPAPAYPADNHRFSDAPRHSAPSYQSYDDAESGWSDYSQQADHSGYDYPVPGQYAAILDDMDDDFNDEDTSTLNQWAPPFLTEPLDNNHALISDADWANLYWLETWVRKRVQAVGPRMTRQVIKHYMDIGRFNPAMGAMLLQIASIVTDQDTAPALDEKYESAERLAAFADDKPASPITHNTILKLIARLQTTGVSRRNGNG